MLSTHTGRAADEERMFVSTPGYLSLKLTSQWASVSLKTIKRWIAAGLPVYQGTPGGKVLIRPQDIDVFLQKRQVPQVDLNRLVNETLKEMGRGVKSSQQEAA